MLFKFVQRENKTLYIDRSQTTHKPKIIYKWNGVSKTARPEKPEVTGINETEGYGTDCQEQVQVWHVYCYRSYINSTLVLQEKTDEKKTQTTILMHAAT